MRIGTSSISKNIDKYYIEKIGMPGIVLMENAALKVLSHIDLSRNYYVIICGTGNNGGDGLAVARHLKVMGKNVKVFLISENKKLSEDCRINYEIFKNIGGDISLVDNFNKLDKVKDGVAKADIIIDAILGTGISRELSELYLCVIRLVNESNSDIISIDVPSGMNSDTGEIYGDCIRAHKTVTFQLYKLGFITWGSDTYTGEVIVEDIGIPLDIIKKYHNEMFMTEREQICEVIPSRKSYGFKGDYGRVLVISGSVGLSGAAYITTESIVKCGAGLVTLCTPKELQPILSEKLVEAMTVSFDDTEKLEELIKKSSVIAFGPGLGNTGNTLKLLNKVLLNAKCPLVIDADGINVLKDNIGFLKNYNYPVIITPHIGEIERICSYTKEYIIKNRVSVAKEIAKANGIIVLLKGYNTVITDGEKTYINPTGNSAMASGGMGDCLTGIIAGLIAQGIDPFKAVYSGAYIHGYIGEKLSKDSYTVIARDVIDYLPKAIMEIKDYKP